MKPKTKLNSIKLQFPKHSENFQIIAIFFFYDDIRNNIPRTIDYFRVFFNKKKMEEGKLV